MKYNLITILGLSIMFWSGSLLSDAAPLDLSNMPKGSTSKARVKAAHEAIKHQLSVNEVRLAILRATITNSKVKWILEEEGNDYMVFRWDYSRKTIYSKIEYNQDYVQMKYAGASKTFRCEKEIEGICYKNNSSKYYSYMKRLKKSLIATLKP